MASIEFIQKRITGKQKELEKLNKRLERIRKAESFGYDDAHNPYLYNEYDLDRCLKDISEAQQGLGKYQKQLEEANEKAASRDVKVILDFLGIWKQQVRQYYGENLRHFFDDRDASRDAYRKANDLACTADRETYMKALEEARAMQQRFRTDCRGTYEKQTITNRWGREETVSVKVKDGKYEPFKPYTGYGNYDEAMAMLEKHISEEADRKYDFIIQRTNRIVGQITDASQLCIGAKQDLNGYIVGTKGTAKVQTIGAGGYNIQCFHFRTLINEVK